MGKFEFEVQECRKVVIESHDLDDARRKLLFEISTGDCLFEDPYVSDGVEIK